MRTKDLVEAGFLLNISMLLYLISSYIPVLGVGAELLCAVPLVLIALRNGFRVALGVALLTAIMIYLFLGSPLSAVIFLIEYGLLGAVLGGFVARGTAPEQSIIYTMFVVLIVDLLFILVAIYGFDSITVRKLVMPEVDPGFVSGVLDNVRPLLQKSGLTAGELRLMMGRLESSLELSTTIMRNYFPISLAVYFFIVATISYYMAAKLAGHLHYEMAEIGPWFMITVPGGMWWLGLAALGANFVLVGPLQLLVRNVLFLVVILYLIQGLIVAMVAMSYWRLPGVVRGGIVILLYYCVSYLLLYVSGQLPQSLYLGAVPGAVLFAIGAFEFKLELRKKITGV